MRSTLFARIVTALGIETAKPKQLEAHFPRRFGLNATMLGSHLQKYKLKLQKQYGLASFKEFKNWMFVDYGDETLRQIAAKWRNPKFPGYSDSLIKDVSQIL